MFEAASPIRLPNRHGGKSKRAVRASLIGNNDIRDRHRGLGLLPHGHMRHGCLHILFRKVLCLLTCCITLLLNTNKTHLSGMSENRCSCVDGYAHVHAHRRH